MKQASRHAVLIYFIHERIEAYGSQSFTEATRLVEYLEVEPKSLALVLCLLHKITVFQVDPKLKH